MLGLPRPGYRLLRGGGGGVLKPWLPMGECLHGARPARYFSTNYPDFSHRFTLSWPQIYPLMDKPPE